jgi:hypothetical protein
MLAIEDLALVEGYILVDLNEDEMQYVTGLAHDRNEEKKQRLVKSKKYASHRSDFDIHFDSARARMAIAKLLGLDMDESADVHGRRGRPDFTLRNGLTLEVHYRSQLNWDYALSSSDVKDFRADVGVLVWPGTSRSNVRLVGWTSKINFVMRSIVKDYGYGPRLALQAKNTFPIETLLRLARSG